MKHLFIIMLSLCGAVFSVLAQQVSFQLEDLNPNNFNTDFSEYHQPTAVFCAQISNLVYYDLADIDLRIEQLRTKYPDHEIGYMYFTEDFKERPITTLPADSGKTRLEIEKSSTETEVLVLGTKNFVVIAFRGTESMKDLKTDLVYKSYEASNKDDSLRYRGLLAGHGGFRESIRNLIDKQSFFQQLSAFIGQYTQDVAAFPVYTTGHSLGGALAIASIKPLMFNSDFNFQGTYTFAPALGISCTDEDKFGDEKLLIHNIINHTDIVPRLNYNIYRHIGKFYRFSRYALGYCTENDGWLFEEEVRFLKNTGKENLRFAKSVLKYHRLDRYVERIKLSANSTESVKSRGFDKNCSTRDLQVIEYECPLISGK